MSRGIAAGSMRMNAHLTDLFRQVPLLVTTAIVFSICGAILAAFHIPLPNPIDTLANAGLFLLSFLFIVFGDIIITLFRERPERPLALLRARYWNTDLVCRIFVRVPIFLVLIIFMPLFGQMKSLIPVLHPYNWDHAFLAADQIIFGTDAWLALHPVVGYPIVTSGLSILYHAWVMLLYPGTLFVILHSSCDRIRQRYFLCFVLIWSVLGIAGATMLASVGPCFLEPIKGDPHFAPLTTYLKDAAEHYPVMVLHVQDLLLASYREEKLGLGMGISAMPSMHVAMAFIYYLAMREVSRIAGWAFLIFTALIWIGSVHLAYHYAVDGLLSIVMTAALWILSKHIIAWWDKRVVALGWASKPADLKPA